jgi:hypothetical protein
VFGGIGNFKSAAQNISKLFDARAGCPQLSRQANSVAMYATTQEQYLKPDICGFSRKLPDEVSLITMEAQCASVRHETSEAMDKAIKVKKLSKGYEKPNSLAQITRSILKHGSRVKKLDMYEALDQETSSNLTSLQTALCEAMDTTLATSRSKGLSERAAIQMLQTEANRILNSIGETLSRDHTAIIHNRAMRKREASLSIAGIVCLVFPILVLFDTLTQFLPGEFRSVLAVGAQDDSSFGALSR